MAILDEKKMIMAHQLNKAIHMISGGMDLEEDSEEADAIEGLEQVARFIEGL